MLDGKILDIPSIFFEKKLTHGYTGVSAKPFIGRNCMRVF
jgi:hypothetical protein